MIQAKANRWPKISQRNVKHGDQDDPPPGLSDSPESIMMV